MQAPATYTLPAATNQTPTPTIITPLAGDGILFGTGVPSVLGLSETAISISINGVSLNTTGTDSSGKWDYYPVSLNNGDVISVTAQEMTANLVPVLPVSAAVTATVLNQTATPVIAAVIDGTTSVSGTAVAGSSISLTVNGGPAPTATADSSGNWTVTGLTPLTAYSIIDVTATAPGEAVSLTAQAYA